MNGLVHRKMGRFLLSKISLWEYWDAILMKTTKNKLLLEFSLEIFQSRKSLEKHT